MLFYPVSVVLVYLETISMGYSTCIIRISEWKCIYEEFLVFITVADVTDIFVTGRMGWQTHMDPLRRSTLRLSSLLVVRSSSRARGRKTTDHAVKIPWHFSLQVLFSFLHVQVSFLDTTNFCSWKCKLQILCKRTFCVVHLVCCGVCVCTTMSSQGKLWGAAGARSISSDGRILMIGMVTAVFEAVLYVFIFIWTPSLQRRAVARSGGTGALDGTLASAANSAADTAGVVPLGLVFAAYMVSKMCGTYLFKHLERATTPEEGDGSVRIECLFLRKNTMLIFANLSRDSRIYSDL